jgi:hypothetical protein
MSYSIFGTEEKHMAAYGYSRIKAYKAQYEQSIWTFFKQKDRIMIAGINT